MKSGERAAPHIPAAGQTRRAAIAVLGLTIASGCSAYRAIDEALDSWPRYTIPGSRASVALPSPPQFTTEPLPGSPCGDLVRVSFSVRGKFGLYSGHFIGLTPQCSESAAHAVGLQMLVTPSAGPEWRAVSTQAIRSTDGLAGKQVMLRHVGSPPTVRVAQTYLLSDGVLGVSVDRRDSSTDEGDAAKFFRWVRTR